LEELTMRIPYYFSLGLFIAMAAQAQQQPELRARELFYTPVAEVKPAPSPAKQVSSSRPSQRLGPRSSVPNESVPPQSVQVAGRQQNTPDARMPEGARMQKTSTVTPERVSGPPLALKYRL
jgi:hypothetical protein